MPSGPSSSRNIDGGPVANLVCCGRFGPRRCFHCSPTTVATSQPVRIILDHRRLQYRSSGDHTLVPIILLFSVTFIPLLYIASPRTDTFAYRGYPHNYYNRHYMVHEYHYFQRGTVPFFTWFFT